ncbi:MAG: phosphonopyruvate decarboxylase, partial [Gammaproteobacteria bacterium]|nr:phosphonopyruvate decarboxylase [Gammaproteobacteria bacterium]
GVPCSFLTPFINYVINDNSLSYISSANEGDALATAAGSTIGGERAIVMMQNSGLGNAVSPLTSLAYVFRIPLLIITTLRGEAGLSDEPQHELMGMITDKLFDIMQVPWKFFPTAEAQIPATLERAMQFMEKERRPYALIMKKGTVAPCQLNESRTPRRQSRTARQQVFHNVGVLPTRNEALKKIIHNTPDNNFVVIATTGYTGRELFALADRDNHLYMVGSMGCASSLALGLALARPDLTVVVIDGDGAALMRMGNFGTLGNYAGDNLIHILLDNEAHDSTGGQATVTGNITFADIAAACGYGVAYGGNDISLIDEVFASPAESGARFLHLKIRPGTVENLPRPDRTPVQVLDRLMQKIHTHF